MNDQVCTFQLNYGKRSSGTEAASASVCVHLKTDWIYSVSCERVQGGGAEFLLMGMIKKSEHSQPMA